MDKIIGNTPPDIEGQGTPIAEVCFHTAHPIESLLTRQDRQ